MPHCDADTLSLLALGETAPGGTVDEAHLAGCPRCQSELDQLRAVVATARAITDDDVPGRVPDRVWSSIAAELALDDRTVPRGADGAEHRPELAAVPTPADPPGVPAQPAPLRTEAMDNVVPLRRRSPSPWVVGVAAALVGVLAGAVVVRAADSADPTPSPTVLATASLDPLNEPAATGTATLQTAADSGQRTLAVDVSGLPATDGFYEVWLLDESAERLVSLGSLEVGDTGSFPVPDDLDIAEFPVVDVSREPLDGNPAHSADSVVRGTLSA